MMKLTLYLMASNKILEIKKNWIFETANGEKYLLKGEIIVYLLENG